MKLEHVKNRLGEFWFYTDQNNKWIFHREEDLPAAIWATGEIAYYKHGLLDRHPGPAVIKPYGAKYWYQQNKHHRINYPAIIGPNGTVSYLVNGLSHNPVGPSFVLAKKDITSPRDLVRAWEIWGRHHRLDGPSVEYADGTYECHLFGRSHFYYGPCRIDSDGKVHYALHGVELTENRFSKLVQSGNPIEISARFYDYERSSYTRRHVLRALKLFHADKIIRSLKFTDILVDYL